MWKYVRKLPFYGVITRILPSIIIFRYIERDGITAVITDNLKSVTVEVTDVRMINVGDLPTVYVTASDGRVYKGYLNQDESLVLIRVGDWINISCEDTAVEGIYTIRSWFGKKER